LHNRLIAPGEAEITIRLSAGERGKIAVRIEHCRPCGAGWFISRAKFVRLCGGD
jgi:hypothetical protein